MGLNYIQREIEGKIRISPSSIYTLYDNPRKWYKTYIEKTVKNESNEEIVIGSIIHDRIERFYNGLEPDTDAEFEYMQQFKYLPQINEWNIADVVNGTWNYLRDEYLRTTIKPMSQEEYLEFEPKSNPDIFVSGTYDYLYKRDNKTILGDYKTCSTLPKEIKTHHRIQLLVYALLLKLTKSVIVDEIEITYIQKANIGTISEKTGNRIGVKKPEAIALREPITGDDIQFILKELKNIGDRISFCKQDSKFIELMFPTNYLSHF